MTLVTSRRSIEYEDLQPSWLDQEPSWSDLALCAQTDPEAFFPEKGGSTREAKRVCRSCEVRAECLEYALENDERFGIWGGLSERERRRVRRIRNGPAPTPMCPARVHLMTKSNTGRFGNCRACQQEKARAETA
jgi:WhiB family transcriptional regulator, redox-sensing transcriptional regulator